MNLPAVIRGVSVRPRTILAVTEVALVVVLGVQAARLAWSLAAPPPGPLGAPAVTARPTAADTDILARFDPFFRQGLATGPASASAPQGDFQLYGVRTGGPGGGSAIIGAAGGEQRLYTVGEQLPGGLTLASVAADHVMLGQGPGGRRLSFPVPGATPGAAPPPPPPPTAAAAGESQAAVTGAQLRAAMTLTPRLQGGRPAGYAVVARGAEGSAILARAGLQPGDVLLAVDGSELNPERVGELADILASAGHVDLRYERGGQVMTTRLRMTAP